MPGMGVMADGDVETSASTGPLTAIAEEQSSTKKPRCGAVKNHHAQGWEALTTIQGADIGTVNTLNLTGGRELGLLETTRRLVPSAMGQHSISRSHVTAGATSIQRTV